MNLFRESGSWSAVLLSVIFCGACAGPAPVSTPPPPEFRMPAVGSDTGGIGDRGNMNTAEFRVAVRDRELQARVEELMLEGKIFYDQGRFDEALAKYREAERVLEQRNRVAPRSSGNP